MSQASVRAHTHTNKYRERQTDRDRDRERHRERERQRERERATVGKLGKVMVAFSSLVRIWGRMFDNSLPTLHFFFSSFFF